MRVSPYFLGAAIVVAIGGAVAGEAIDTTPRKIHDSTPIPGQNAIAFDDSRERQALSANHYPLETDGQTVEVAELRERGLYSQDRYARTYYYTDSNEDDFDFDAADRDQQRWEASQRRSTERYRPSPRQPLKLDKPAKVSEAKITYVSKPVVQDTSEMPSR